MTYRDMSYCALVYSFWRQAMEDIRITAEEILKEIEIDNEQDN